MADKLEYRDFRPIREGDAEYTVERSKARWYFSPSSNTAITYYRFVTASKGGISYKKLAKQREKEGIEKKRYRPRKSKTISKKSTKKRQAPKKHIAKKGQRGATKKELAIGRAKSEARDRLLILKGAFAKRNSEFRGRDETWDDMTNNDQTLFWEMYHELVYHGKPGEDEFSNYYENFFDMEYDEVEDLEFGETP